MSVMGMESRNLFAGMSMKSSFLRSIILALSLGILLSVLSGFIATEARVSHDFWSTDGQDCRIEPCKIAAAGWPYSYIWDQTWNSPVNSADWIGVLITVDHFNPNMFFKNTIFWLFLTASAFVLNRIISEYKNRT